MSDTQFFPDQGVTTPEELDYVSESAATMLRAASWTDDLYGVGGAVWLPALARVFRAHADEALEVGPDRWVLALANCLLES